MNEDISRRLHQAADAYQPDRGRILERVRHGMASADVATPKPGIARSWTRVTFAGLAAAGALATAGLAVAAIVHTAPPPDPGTIPTSGPSSTTTSPAPPVRTTDEPVAPPAQPELTSTTNPPSVTDPAPLSGKPVADGPLSSVGFIDLQTHPNWAQSRVVLKTTQRLTSFSLEVRVVQTGGVHTTGQWQTLPADDFTVTVKEVDGAVVYRWELKPGRAVPEGVHTFAGQYNHAAGKRDARADTYVGTGGAATVRGGFTSQ